MCRMATRDTAGGMGQALVARWIATPSWRMWVPTGGYEAGYYEASQPLVADDTSPRPPRPAAPAGRDARPVNTAAARTRRPATCASGAGTNRDGRPAPDTGHGNLTTSSTSTPSNEAERCPHSHCASA